MMFDDFLRGDKASKRLFLAVLSFVRYWVKICTFFVLCMIKVVDAEVLGDDLELSDTRASIPFDYCIYLINRPGRSLNFWTLRVGVYSRLGAY